VRAIAFPVTDIAQAQVVGADLAATALSRASSTSRGCKPPLTSFFDTLGYEGLDVFGR